MSAQLYPGGWEVKSESEASEGWGDGIFTDEMRYEAGLIGGGRHDCLGPHNVSKMEPEEEDSFRREAQRAA